MDYSRRGQISDEYLVNGIILEVLNSGKAGNGLDLLRCNPYEHGVYNSVANPAVGNAVFGGTVGQEMGVNNLWFSAIA